MAFWLEVWLGWKSIEGSAARSNSGEAAVPHEVLRVLKTADIQRLALDAAAHAERLAERILARGGELRLCKRWSGKIGRE